MSKFQMGPRFIENLKFKITRSHRDDNEDNENINLNSNADQHVIFKFKLFMFKKFH